jgi:uncharacterized protein with von Willebrand factor type A (vWA) domain
MKIIESALHPTDGYITTFTRNTVEGWWELEVGIPKSWVFNENNEIKCDVITESDFGKLIKISPKNTNVVIDDLVSFVEIIIKTNEKIAKKEQEFGNEMAEMKKMLEEKAKKFYQELDELKENSFKKNNDEFVKSLQSEKEDKKRVGRPRKEENTTDQTTNDTTE